MGNIFSANGGTHDRVRHWSRPYTALQIKMVAAECVLAVDGGLKWPGYSGGYLNGHFRRKCGLLELKHREARPPFGLPALALPSR